MSKRDLILTPAGVRFMGRTLPCSIGRNGVSANKREGDQATPAGLWRITGVLFRPDRIATRSMPGWARPIAIRDLWCDAPDHAAYNKPVRAPFTASHERLFRADPLYDLVLTTDWNGPAATPGRGSAIFLHRWRRPGFPTAGCIAFSLQDLLWIVPRIRPGTAVIVRA